MGAREKERERGRGREIDTCKKEATIWLPPICSLTRNQTHNLLVCGTTCQPTEPYARANIILKTSQYPGW